MKIAQLVASERPPIIMSKCGGVSTRPSIQSTTNTNILTLPDGTEIDADLVTGFDENGNFVGVDIVGEGLEGDDPNAVVPDANITGSDFDIYGSTLISAPGLIVEPDPSCLQRIVAVRTAAQTAADIAAGLGDLFAVAGGDQQIIEQDGVVFGPDGEPVTPPPTP